MHQALPATASQPALHPASASRTLLLVDDEPHVISSLKRALRADGYTLLTSSDPHQALRILDSQPVDVILCDQRMPGMSGVEFLRRAHVSHPQTMRIVLSGYTDLQFITDAINEGAIYKFLTKPWDDEQLRRHIQEAFRVKEISDENQRLTEDLRRANKALERQASLAEAQTHRLEMALGTLQEVMHLIPWPILGLDEDGLIALTNSAADRILSNDGKPLLGRDASEALRAEILAGLAATTSSRIEYHQRHWRLIVETMGHHSASLGRLVALLPDEGQP